MSRYIHNLIAQGENQHLDFKFEISDVRKIARTFSSFANTEGGILLIGVKDNGVISGIRTDEEAYMVESAADLFCRPKVEYKMKPHQIGDKIILEVKILESLSKPHLAPWKNNIWKPFVRVGDQNFIANNVLKEVWKLKHSNKKVKVKYNNFEETLFKLLESRDKITLEDFKDTCNIPLYLAEKILANLIAIDLIGIKIFESEAYYFMK